MIDPRDALLVAESYSHVSKTARNAADLAGDDASIICRHHIPRWARLCWPVTRAVLAGVADWLAFEASSANQVAQEAQQADRG